MNDEYNDEITHYVVTPLLCLIVCIILVVLKYSKLLMKTIIG